MLKEMVLQILFYYLSAILIIAAGYHLTFAKKNGRTAVKRNSFTEKNYLVLLLSIGITLRIITAPVFYGHDIDMGCFKGWSLTAANDLFKFYNNAGFIDYPPLYVYVLFIIAKLAGIFGIMPNHWGYTIFLKLPSMIADMVTAYLLYKLSEKHLQPKYRVILASLYIFNPLTLMNSTIWGQVDSFFTMLLISALIYLDRGNIQASSAIYAAAVLMKPQGIIFLPVLFFELVKRKDLRAFVLSAAYGLLTAFLIILPFSFTQKPLWIYNLYVKTTGGYKGASVNAYNFFALVGANWKDDTLPFLGMTYAAWGLFFIVSVTLFTGFLYLKGKESSLAAITSTVLITGVFVLSSKMHERYMFPAAALSLLAFILVKDWRVLLFYLASSITGFINTVQVFSLSLSKVYWVPAQDATLRIVAVINMLLFIFLIWIALDIIIKNKFSLLNIGIPEEKTHLKKIRKR